MVASFKALCLMYCNADVQILTYVWISLHLVAHESDSLSIFWYDDVFKLIPCTNALKSACAVYVADVEILRWNFILHDVCVICFSKKLFLSWLCFVMYGSDLKSTCRRKWLRYAASPIDEIASAWYNYF